MGVSEDQIQVCLLVAGEGWSLSLKRCGSHRADYSGLIVEATSCNETDLVHASPSVFQLEKLEQNNGAIGYFGTHLKFPKCRPFSLCCVWGREGAMDCLVIGFSNLEEQQWVGWISK